jgi:hypothetical protein
MAIEAAVVQYRKDFVPAFEQRVSLLKSMTTKESMVNGLTATFLVAGSGGDTAVTRGTNGMIPYNNPTNSQIPVTLVEKHAPYRLTGFNVFASQGDQVRIMRNNSIAVINRDIDDTLITELENATQDFGTGTATLNTVLGAQAILGGADVETEDMNNMFALITPAFRAYLMANASFSNGEWVDIKPFVGPARRFWQWAGVNWAVSNRLPGRGTSDEHCFMFHRSAIGYAVNVGEEKVFAGYDEQQAYSWSRAEVYHAAKILQNSGIVKIHHDGSAFVAT